MRSVVTMNVVFVLGLLVGASTASAQTPVAWNGSVSFGGGGQLTSTTLTDSATFTEFVEDGTLRADYDVRPAVLADVGVAWRLWRRLGVGVSVSSVGGTDVATVTLRAPHPFFFDRHRTFDESVDVERRTVGGHIGAVYMVPAGDRIRITVAGGPSVFRVSQDLVADVAFEEGFPFDTLVNPNVVVRQATETVVGFHVAVDVGVRIGSRWGVGWLARFARASVDLTTSGDRAGNRTVATDVGGFQVGGGLRFFF